MTLKIAADDHIPYVNDYFSDQAEIHLFSGRHVSSHDVHDADVLLVRAVTPVNEKLLSQSRVRFVGSVTAGYDHLDMEWLKNKGITVQLAHGFNAQSVADYVLSVLLVLHKQHRIQFNKQLSIAVVGVGAVGLRVAKHAEALGVTVLLYDPLRAETESEFQSCSWEEVLHANVICIHVPWSRDGTYPTHQFLNKTVFQKLKSGTIIINAARGEVLNEDDFLHAGHHVVLCTDVWMHEPHCNLPFMERVHLASPHLAGYSWHSKSRGIFLIYEALRAAGFALQSREMVMSSAYRPMMVQTTNWIDAVLSVFDPSQLSDEFKLACFTAKNPHQVFDEWRRHYPLRHELAFVKYDARDLSPADSERLRVLGLICAP